MKIHNFKVFPRSNLVANIVNLPIQRPDLMLEFTEITLAQEVREWSCNLFFLVLCFNITNSQKNNDTKCIELIP